MYVFLFSFLFQALGSSVYPGSCESVQQLVAQSGHEKGQPGGLSHTSPSHSLTHVLLDILGDTPFCSVEFSSIEDGVNALGKANMRPTLSLRSFPQCCPLK